ncbi:TPA: hypothetical protein ACQ30S_004215 [Yersinia enterocolitica]
MIRKFDFGYRGLYGICWNLPLHTTDMIFEHRALIGLDFMSEALRDALREWIESEHFLISEKPTFHENPNIKQISLVQSLENFVLKNKGLGAELDQYIEWLERVGGHVIIDTSEAISLDTRRIEYQNLVQTNIDAWCAILTLLVHRPEKLKGYSPSGELLELLKSVQARVVAPEKQLKVLEKTLQPDWDQYEEVTAPSIPRSEWDQLIYKEVVLDFEIDLNTVLVIAPEAYHFSKVIDWYDETFTNQQKQDLFAEVVQHAQRLKTLGCNGFSLPLEKLRYRPSGETYV